MSTALSLSQRRILIVDDDRMNIRILENILQKEGFEIATADSGESALERYVSFKPHLVLLDVMLPGLDGFETCRRLHATHGDTTAPIIFITAKVESDDVVTGLAAGGIDYLPKPFRPKEAIARIRIHLQNRLLLKQLGAANAAKNKFLGMAAHDLRNPLASIRGLAEFLEDPSIGPLNPEQLDLVRTIHAASQSMLRLVNELLDVSVIESGELRLATAPTDIVQLVEKSIRLARIDAAKKLTTIVLAPPPAISGPFVIDPDKITQVVDNLLSNAVKYSPPGAMIDVAVTPLPSACRISVRDQGPGIPDHERDRLFQDYGRLSNKPTGGEQSTGLGLAICRKIVEAHRGEISADNLPGHGCEFSFTLPSTS
ncbi:MAG: response regulator [Verrucomicrobiota bacterium]